MLINHKKYITEIPKNHNGCIISKSVNNIIKEIDNAILK